MGTRLLSLSLLLSVITTNSSATVPLSPQPVLSFLAIEDDRRRSHVSYVLNERHDDPVDGSEVSRERASNGLWYQFQAGNGFRVDASLQHIHETLSDPDDSASLRNPAVARFGTGVSGGLGWTIPITQWGDQQAGWRSAVGLHLGGAGFFSREGDRFAPFAGSSELLGYTASSAIGFEFQQESIWRLRDLQLVAFLELTPLVNIESKELPIGSFEDNPESDGGIGWMRGGLSVGFNWSETNSSPVILSYSVVLAPVEQHTFGVGLGF
ncbi:MAG: hypothetical protein CL940_06055 [Deltaproteobacteria bacterium]|nr:hypothetical protein [Deltaproteobacteria bacterium]